MSDDLSLLRSNNNPYPETMSGDLRLMRESNSYDPSIPIPATRSKPGETDGSTVTSEIIQNILAGTQPKGPGGRGRPTAATAPNGLTLQDLIEGGHAAFPDASVDTEDGLMNWLQSAGSVFSQKPPTENAQKYGIDWSGIGNALGFKEPTAVAQASGVDWEGIGKMFGFAPNMDGPGESLSVRQGEALADVDPKTVESTLKELGVAFAPGQDGGVLTPNQMIASIGADTGVDERLPEGFPGEASLLEQLQQAGVSPLDPNAPTPATFEGKRGQVPSDIIYALLGEAAGEGNAGLEAVASVIQNRAESGRYPGDPLAVVNQPMQFSALNPLNQGGNNPQGRFPALGDDYNAAEAAYLSMQGASQDPTTGALHYWATDSGKPYWADDEMKRAGVTDADLIQIGGHTFIPNSGAPQPADPASGGPATGGASEPTIWDNVVNGASQVFENTTIGGVAKTLFPEFWEDSGKYFKGLDGGSGQPGQTAGGSRYNLSEAMGGRGQGPRGVSADLWDWVMRSSDSNDSRSNYDPSGGYGYPAGGGMPGPAIVDINKNGIPDHLEPGMFADSEDRDVFFPKLPPYAPGVDDEFLYFRPRPKAKTSAVTGMGAGYQPFAQNNPTARRFAEGGVVTADGLDPRVAIIQEAEQALAGRSPDPEQAIRAFVDAFGEEALGDLQEKVMLDREREEPRLIEGPGGPTDDMVPAMINGNEPAKLSDGEFVMTADAVMGAGQGDPERGAEQLMQLNDMLAGASR